MPRRMDDLRQLELLNNRTANRYGISGMSNLSSMYNRGASEFRLALHQYDELLDEIDEFQNEIDFIDDEARVVSRHGREYHLAFDPAKIASTQLIARITSRYPVHDLLVENPPIEERIAQLYQRNQVEDHS